MNATCWTEQSLALSVLALAQARDPGNRGRTWTPREVEVADDLDDRYMADDLAGFGCEALFLADGDL
jgi:hypothetical protein